MHFNMGCEVNTKHRGLDMISKRQGCMILNKRKLYRALTGPNIAL